MGDYSEVQGPQDAARYARESQSENSARHATTFLRHITTGTGSIRTGLLKFDVVFLEEPSVVSGVVLEQAPDAAHYQLPSVTVGVHRWETKPYPSEEASGNNKTFKDVVLASGTSAVDKKKKLYVGAHLFFNVLAAPHYTPRTDGSNLLDLEARLVRTAPGTPEYLNLLALIKEAQEALHLKANPAKVRLVHHLQFQGEALKGRDLDTSAVLTPVLETRTPKIG